MQQAQEFEQSWFSNRALRISPYQFAPSVFYVGNTGGPPYHKKGKLFSMQNFDEYSKSAFLSETEKSAYGKLFDINKCKNRKLHILFFSLILS